MLLQVLEKRQRCIIRSTTYICVYMFSCYIGEEIFGTVFEQVDFRFLNMADVISEISDNIA